MLLWLYMKTTKLPKKRNVSLKITAIHDVLPYIASYMQENHGLAPSIYGIGKQFNKTGEWARLCLKILTKEKLIKRVFYKRRGITLVNKK